MAQTFHILLSTYPKSASIDNLPVLHNKCVILVLSNLENIDMVDMLGKQINQRPSMVIYIRDKDHSGINGVGYQHELWIEHNPGHKHISLTGGLVMSHPKRCSL